MFKKLWNIFKYTVLVLLIISMLSTLYLRQGYRTLEGIILILFWVAMILRQNIAQSNKFISSVYHITSMLIVTYTVVEVLFGFKK